MMILLIKILIILMVIIFIYVLKYKFESPEVFFEEEEEENDYKINYEDIPLNDTNLKRLEEIYKLKEEYTIYLIKEKFNPDELSYTYFMDIILKSHDAFYKGLKEVDSLYKIRFNFEYEKEVNKLKKIVREMEDLMIELIKNKNHFEEEMIVDDLKHLKESVKNYGEENE